MLIKGRQKTTLIDYTGKIASTIFLFGCNFRCGYCHNPGLVIGKKEDEPIYSEEEILDFLKERKKYPNWGVCISGGEPTLQAGLLYFMEKIKKIGLPAKLDTNGSNFSVLQELRKKGLFDYVAMDVKGPPELYPGIIGRKDIDFRDDVEKGMAITTQFPDYEFRTTVAPVVRDDGNITIMTPEEVVDIAKWIVHTTGSNEHKYRLQPFVPQKGKLMDSRFERFPETPESVLETCLKKARNYLPNATIRGQ